ncbi:armadillo-type protein [Cokeromyces recurvatus]|uniref:armadillo-type protein n=1 Tax=Cokeromyces recurvatus TaxID=90255 RepID=UPI002220F683|nr:armadillo-type protein [Cokeromyces recurvatus]KAI7907940.1 armadillo-type protein [Cokeromyces recurvatus]
MSHQGTNAYMVASLLEKMSNEDRDFRYMALNDLMSELQKASFNMEYVIENKVVKAVLQLMDDKNSEVQNLAVKCLGPLVKQVKEESLCQIMDLLSEFASQQKNDELRGIASVGLKTVVVEVDPDRGNQVCARIIPKLLNTIQNVEAAYEMQMDTLDILAEVLAKFGGQISVEQQTDIQNILLPLLSYNRAAVRKKVTVAIGYLVVHLNDESFNQVFAFLLEGLRNDVGSSEKIRTLVQCAGVLSRYSAARLGAHLSQIVPIINKYTVNADEDDELREICLQTLESFILRCPTEIAPFVQEITNLALEYIKYDPNFVEDDDEEVDDMELEDEEEQDEYDDIADYSDDDDDMSWKVRRSASKVLSAIIETRLDLLQQLYENVAPVLISRFKEREETVRVDILQTFISLLRQTDVYGGNAEEYTRQFNISSMNDELDLLTTACPYSSSSMETINGPRQLLQDQVPSLCRALSKQLNTKSIQTRQIGFHLLREVLIVLHGGLKDQMELFFPAIESSLSTTTAEQQHASSSNLKIEVLYFLRLFFRNHPADHIHAFIHHLAPSIIKSVSDRFYKITSEAFLVCIELLKVIRPIYREKSGKYQVSSIKDTNNIKYVNDIFEVTLKTLNTSDADQEVKERSIMCLGTLLAHVCDVLQSKQKQAWDVLLERLRNEVTRLISVKTLAIVCQSPVAAGEELQRCVLVAVDEISLFLRKSNRPLRVASLECLIILIQRFGQIIPAKSFSSLLTELKPLISDSDLLLLPLALNVVQSILVTSPQSVNEIKVSILPSLFKLIESPLLQGSALDSLLNMFAAFGKVNPADYQTLVNGLVHPLLNVKTATGVAAGGVAAVSNKQAASTVAQCVAVLAANANQMNRNQTVKEFQSYILNPTINDSIKYLSLLSIGEIGRRIDLSEFPEINEQVIHLFSAQSEEIKFAAAFALGNICVGNINNYLPPIVSQIKEEPKKRYLLLHALKEVITRNESKNDISNNSLSNAADEIWTLLLESSETDQEEGTRTVVAECLGKLALTDPSKFLPQLEDRLESSSSHVRAAVATAIKYAVVNPSSDYDEFLKPIMVKFLNLLEDSDLNVRRLALLTLNSAAHRKPYLIRNTLDQLIPLLYAETVVKEELIHTVEMGPFKHKVDDGLEIRKAAYECMYTLLSTCLDKVDVYGFLDHIRAGLDDQHDIKMLAYLMLVRISKVAPAAVSQRLNDFVEPFKTTLDFKMRSNAVKQEVEKNQELIRAVLRCIVALYPLSDPSMSPGFEMFVMNVRTGPFAEEYRLAFAEAEGRENRSNDYMDLS